AQRLSSRTRSVPMAGNTKSSTTFDCHATFSCVTPHRNVWRARPTAQERDPLLNRFTLISAASPKNLPQRTECSMNRAFALLATACSLTSLGLYGQNSQQRLELDRKGQTIVLEPYAPNILRVTLSLQREPALAKPGYGFVGSPDAAGWN